MHGGIQILKSPKDKIYDRLSSDLPINSQVAPAVVDDPLEPGAKLRVIRSLRDDPLAWMHNRGRIDDAELEAGRKWQADYELIEIGGARGVDITKDAVDGGRFHDPLENPHRKRASDRIAAIDGILGQRDSLLIRDILGRCLNLAQAAAARNLLGERGINYVGRRFSDILESLVQFYGLTARRS